jgi:hypothetical protein
VKNRERDAAARAFLAIADELAGADKDARQKAGEHAAAMIGHSEEAIDFFVEAFTAGWIRDATARAAEQIRQATTHYLTQRAKPRGRR